MEFRAIDIETAGDEDGYALQPWRVREGSARVTLVGIYTAQGVRQRTEGFVELLNQMPPQTFVGWNTMFDVSFLYASGVDVRRHTWVDARLFAKWWANGQDNEDAPRGYWSLGNVAERELTTWEHREVFVKLKNAEVEPGQNDKYWEVRNKLDVVATQHLCKLFWDRLNPNQKRGALIEATNIAPAAMAYVEGIPTNPDVYEKAQAPTLAAMHTIEDKLGVRTSADKPSEILRSSKKLANLLYNQWGLPCETLTDKGAPSTSKAALTYLADHSDKVLDILAWRSHNTVLTKFLQSPTNSKEYLTSSVFHPEPRIFSTYTGRYTYSSKCLGKYPIGMALHQMPRNGAVRDMVKIPEDKILVEFDASGQEARLLAEVGHINTLKNTFVSGINYHTETGASISGMDYDSFKELLDSGDPLAKERRYAGKFCNLSFQYRVGLRKARIQARVQYDMVKTMEDIKGWRQAWLAKHPGVNIYWSHAPQRARQNGYAETLAGRRFYINKWDADNEWSSSSSAINFPIQGSGGDMKNLAIKHIYENYPELQFMWDLHDGLFYMVDRTPQAIKLCQQVRQDLDNLNYKEAWSYEPEVPLTWDLQVGLKWSKMKEV
jgi:DNA polymerase I-like protein with 3'-5' exonuclease and polymerase domains